MAQTIFTEAEPLPRGPHGLTREQVRESQRARLLAAITRLVAEHGFAALTIGEIAGEAGVSRGAFYEHFDGKEECLLSAYDHFASTLIGAMTSSLGAATPVGRVHRQHARRLSAARSRAIPSPRARSWSSSTPPASAPANGGATAMRGFAALLESRHAEMRAQDPRLGELPSRAYLAIVLGVRELVREALETEPAPQLTELAPDVLLWLTATIEGANAALVQSRRYET